MNWAPIFFLILAVVLWLDVLIFIVRLPHFKRELKYINMEIERSSDKERAYLKGCKRRLILSAILFSTY